MWVEWLSTNILAYLCTHISAINLVVKSPSKIRIHALGYFPNLHKSIISEIQLFENEKLPISSLLEPYSILIKGYF